MLTLVSYPGLFGLADNNPYGLKVFAFLRLAGLDFRHEHVLDVSAAPRGQLPYILDDGVAVGDSDTIIAHLIRTRGLAIDEELTAAQRDTDLLVRRALDDLYWVMSYSRWKDDRYWPQFRQALLGAVPREDAAALLEGARQYNFTRYHHQGIGRYEPDAAYARGLADLEVLARLVPEEGFVFGPAPRSLDAGLYGFLANIWSYPIETPLKAFVDSCPNLVAHCRAMHARVSG
ncbi:MAG TPA: glutathione S-transferase C-terminal domain-containing protein [Crenalkalicoccus sp.]|nr:glutathione S-transferase C-terminal domain-containing protein [Crenalkalicoccus sp.]